MGSDLVTPSVEQRCVIRLQVKVKPEEMICRLNMQHGEETLSSASVCDWHSTVSEGRKKALSLSNAHVQPTAVCHVHIHHV
jgi:hypothetical protein